MTYRIRANGPIAPNDREVTRAQVDTAGGDGAIRARMYALLDAIDDPLVRVTRPGHFTGSAVVIEPTSRRLVVLFHRKLQLWLQPGGHADGEADLASVALREATEETGLVGLRVVEPAVDLDIHRVAPPSEDTHEHFDLRFLVLAPPDAVLTGNDESEAIRFVDLAEFDRLVPDDATRRMARRALTALDELHPVDVAAALSGER